MRVSPLFESQPAHRILLDLQIENKFQITTQTRGDRSIIINSLKYVGD
jgi:hypothetical protein